MKAITEKEKKQRKFLVMIPVLILPFLLFLFWILGGGTTASGQTELRESGLNPRLPDAEFKKIDDEDKLAIYQKARTDSLELQEKMKNDPYYIANSDPDIVSDSLAVISGENDPNVAAINDRLTKLYGQINEPQKEFAPAPSPTELDNIQDVLKSMGGTSEADPEMMQLDGMLEKILDIQNPGRAREKLREQSLKNRKQVFAIAGNTKREITTDLTVKSAKPTPNSGFYDWTPAAPVEDEQYSVAAIVLQTATVVSGATIKFRLADDVYIKGKVITKGTFVYGICALSGDRLQVTVNSIRHNNALYPVNLIAYDMDGVAGIYMPGAISRDVAKNSAQDAIQGVDYYGVDNSLTSQAASVGIQAAKSLFSKKAKLIKVTVKAGYRVLLRDANTND